MNLSKKCLFLFSGIFIFLLVIIDKADAQDPKLPPTNLGLSNLQDGNPPGTGWFYQQYVQTYQTQNNRDAAGSITGGARISSILSLSQLIFISKVKLLDGNLGFTVLVPLVKLSAANPVNGPSINPNVLGDIISGPFIQWSPKKLFNMEFDHRAELDVVAPIGAYNPGYAINPGSHLFSIVPHYTFTIFPTANFSFSTRQMFNYNFEQIGSRVKPGMFYNFNYSFEYALTPVLRVELAGYYLTQLNQDSNNGNGRYYQQMDQLTDTREKVFAIGPGLGYVTPSKLPFELKNMWETEAKNRPQGARLTLVLSYKISN